jgi:ferredoxin
MKVKVDAGKCVGTGSCVSLCPQVFELNDEGISTVKANPVPKDAEDACREAIEACPVDAISEA